MDSSSPEAKPKMAEEWRDVFTAGQKHQLLSLLHQWPVSRWSEEVQSGLYPVHVAALYGDVLALEALLEHVPPDLLTPQGWSPLHYAAHGRWAKCVMALLRAGADPCLLADERTPWDRAVSSGDKMAIKAMMVLRGMRLTEVRVADRGAIAPWMWAIEGQANCRQVACVLLGLKRRRGNVLRLIDRFVVRQLAQCIWCTRADPAWHIGRVV